MSSQLLEIMYSDEIATIKNERWNVELRDDMNVANKVNQFLNDTFVQEKERIEIINIVLLSYRFQPKIPEGIACNKWILKCESHSPYVIDLLKSIPLNCELLHVEIDNGGLGLHASTDQMKTARNVSLKTTGRYGSSASSALSNGQLLEIQADTVFISSDSIDEEGINQLLHKVVLLRKNPYFAKIEFNPKTDNPMVRVLKGLDYKAKEGVYDVISDLRKVNITLRDKTVSIVMRWL